MPFGSRIGSTGGLTPSSGDSRYLEESANLSDLDDASTARTNLGLGTMALETASDYYTSATVDSTFLKLDASNDPITGALAISNTLTITTTSGTTPPLDIIADQGSGDGTNFGVTLYSDGSAPKFLFRRARGTLASPTTLSGGQRVVTMDFAGHDGTGFQSMAGIQANVQGTVSTGIVPGQLRFLTTNTSGTLTLAGTIENDGELKMLFDGSFAGNVGIGTASPDKRLHIVGSGASSDGIIIENSSDTASVKPYINFKRSRGTAGSPTAIQNGDIIAQFTMQGYLDSAYDSERRIFETTATETWSATTGGYAFDFYTRPNGSVAGPTLRMKIDQDGLVRAYSDTQIDGNLAVGAGVSSAIGIRQTKTFVGSSTINGIQSTATWQLNGNSSSISIGINATLTMDQNGFDATSTLATIGAQNRVTVAGSSGTVTGATGANYQVVNTGGGVVTRAVGAFFQNNVTTGGGSITNSTGVNIVEQTGGTTNNTNLVVGLTTQPTGAWSIFNVSARDNYFAGSLNIATTTVVAGVSLNVNGSALFNRAGIGTTPTGQVYFHLKNDVNNVTDAIYENQDSGTAAQVRFQLRNGSTALDGMTVGVLGTGFTTNGGFVQDNAYISAESNLGGFSLIARASAGVLRFYTGGFADANQRMLIEAGGNIGINTAPTGQLHVDQSSTTAAEPVLVLDQADVSEELIEVVTTIGTGNTIEAVGAKTLTTTHFLKWKIPGGLIRYMPLGTIA